jgi:hypothetical protein
MKTFAQRVAYGGAWLVFVTTIGVAAGLAWAAHRLFQKGTP